MTKTFFAPGGPKKVFSEISKKFKLIRSKTTQKNAAKTIKNHL
jgi:hypothetical protein